MSSRVRECRIGARLPVCCADGSKSSFRFFRRLSPRLFFRIKWRFRFRYGVGCGAGTAFVDLATAAKPTGGEVRDRDAALRRDSLFACAKTVSEPHRTAVPEVVP